MKKSRVIKFSSLPTKMPIMFSLVWWMFLDRISAPQWLYGVFGVIAALAWLLFFISLWTEDAADPPGFGPDR